MKITLNLATRPYIELRPIYARLRMMALVFAVLALPLLLLLHVEQSKAARVDQLKHNILLLQQQQRAAKSLMQQPDNAGVLTQADFLNELFRRKAFSWTATISDLETTLPAGVQVLTIDPIVAPDGSVTIRLRVSGARERAVEAVRNLEHSRHFIAPRLADEALAQQNPGNVRQVADTGPGDVSFDIIAEYRPLPHSHTSDHAATENAAPAQGEETGGQP
jgi:type IV pilus assembly protein PilN